MITANVDSITEAAAGVGIRREELDDYLGASLSAPVTIAMIATVLKRIPIVFDSAFTVN